MERRLLLRGEVSLTEVVQILPNSDTNDGYASQVSAYPRSFPEVVIVEKVAQGKGYQA
jgi:hypothetical protein